MALQSHVELLHLFLTHSDSIVDKIQGLLNAQKTSIQYQQDPALLSRQLKDCFFTLPNLTRAQSRLVDMLETAHWASGFKPRQTPGNDLVDPADEQIGDIETFLDLMQGILDGEVGGEVNEAEFFRSLPVRRPADLADFQHLDLEILVVDTNKTAARIVERELANCGYRVTLVARSFEALELAIRTRPDMIIASGVLDEMSGIDLASALAVIQPTETIPFALLTSSDEIGRAHV